MQNAGTATNWGITRLLGVLLGMITIVVALAIAPNISTANAAIQSANTTNLIAMSVLDDFGAPLAVLGLLTLGGVFTLGAWKTGTDLKQMMIVLFMAVIIIVGLTFMGNIITYTNNLIGATATDFEDIIWGIIPLFIYVAIIGMPFGYVGYRGYSTRKKRKKARMATVGF